MARKASRGRGKVRTTLREFTKGTLRSSSGTVVRSKKRALAIGLSKAGLSRKTRKRKKRKARQRR